MKEKKRFPILFGILFVAITITVGTTFALWQLTLQQESTNVITTGCFEVTFRDANSINLEKAYPITDEEGKILTPYEFTITNTCNSLASYQINLEVLNTTTLTDLSYIKSALNESTKTISPKLLTTNETVTKTLTDADSSYKLETGYLKANESKTYNLRLWMDENTPTEDTYMNKTFESKVTIAAAYLNQLAPSDATKDYILAKALEGQIVLDDETSDHNLRYIGTDPNNYIDLGDRYTSDVYFGYHSVLKDYKIYYSLESCQNASEYNLNCTKKHSVGDKILWRIIGIMNNIDDGTGKKETRLKVIRADEIGTYSWDSSSSSVNGGYGVNEWSQATANTMLNDYFYDSKANQTCYYHFSQEATPCDFSGIGLSSNAKSLIGNAVWHTGTFAKDENADVPAAKYYEVERGSNHGKFCDFGTCNDTIDRTTTWTGIIGLMYPSDFAYATNGGATHNRNSCLATDFGSTWANNDCGEQDWLKDPVYHEWTIMPLGSGFSQSYAKYIHTNSSGYLFEGYSGQSFFVTPVVYLKSNVLIDAGEGTQESPFIPQNNS